MNVKIEAPIISEDIWGDESKPEKAWYTVRYYKPSGFGIQREWTNVYVATEQEAKWFAQTSYGIPQGMMCLVYAFKQDTRI